MKSRKFYENYFSAYPDVVTLDQFRKMLGGLGEVQARKLMQQNHVKHFYIRGTYFTISFLSRFSVGSRAVKYPKVIPVMSLPFPRLKRIAEQPT